LDNGIESVPHSLIERSCDLSTERRLTTDAPHTTGNFSDNTVQWASLSQDFQVQWTNNLPDYKLRKRRKQ